MKSYHSEYKRKLTTPEDAARLINPRSNISFGMAISQPPALLKAIADLARTNHFDELKLFYLHAEEHANNTVLDYDLMDTIKPYPFSFGRKEREINTQGLANNKKLIHYVPNSFSHVPRFLRTSIHLDAYVTTVSPMDEHGYFSLGTNNDYGSTAARNCSKLIVEVNKNMPRVFGDSQIHISEVTALVENDVPLIEMPPRPAKEEDRTIAEFIKNEIPDGAALQIGVGGVPDTVCGMLTDKNDLGIHTELLTPGLQKLIENGNANGKRKNIHRHKHVFTLAMGDTDLYKFMDNNPSLESYPVDHVNDPAIIGRNDNVISVCGIIEIDLYGQVNAEGLGGRQYGAPGGQNDFVRGAYESKGGKSFVAFESTTKNGTISKIVPRLNNVVTDLRVDTQYVVTEYGCANLKGMSTTERAKVLINMAHPNFRDELRSYAKDLGFI
ncbi:MAG: acetyl-CoA hydrolase/transferase family protein [Hyphomicrobiales bacterium]